MANFQINNYAAFPNAADACSFLDLGILSDIRESNDKPQHCFALGDKSDLAAGLRGFSFTPYFDSMLGLDDFCRKHMDKIRQIAAELENGAGYPSNGWWK